jgi:PAS domain S-box-containing protein
LQPCQLWPDALAEDAEGILVGLGPELHRFRDGQLQPYRFGKEPPPAFYWINNLMVSRDGAIWLASNNGVFRVKGGNWEQWSTANGLRSNVVYSIAEDGDGSIWAGSIAGIVRIKEHRAASVGLKQGLYDDRIFAMVPDDLGAFWISSGHGIFRVARRSLNDCADGRTSRVQCEAFDGLESVKFTDRTDQSLSGCRSLDGRIWFPNPHGVVMIDPRNHFINRLPPPVHVSQVRINDVSLADWKTLIRPAKNGRIEFFFTALSYISPKKVRVQYQLEGFDATWVDAGTHRSVLYNNLRPGQYHFRVQACNADGVWNTAGDDIRLELPPPFYETIWFEGLVGLTGAMALFGAYRWKVRHMAARQRRLQAENDLLEAKVAKRTAELAREHALMQELMDNSLDHIYFKDRESRFLKSSKAQAADFGALSPEDMVGKTDFDYFTTEHATPAFEDDQEIIRTGRPIADKIERVTRKDGHVGWVITSKMPLRNDAGEIIGTFGVSKDITAIKEAEAKLEEVHRELLIASREAGMSEVATSVLHNVGNVLNSVNVSTSLVKQKVQLSKIASVARAGALLREHETDLAAFLTDDPKGRQLPGYLQILAEHLAAEQKEILAELESLARNVDHVNEIVAMQQSYGRSIGVSETLPVADLVEDALRMNVDALAQSGITLRREFDRRPPITIEKHKVLQILVNLIRNANHACADSDRPDKTIVLRISGDEQVVRISVIDNGVGIPPENLTRIFAHGFTTRKGGHGFGLHSGALAAADLGGSLRAESAGIGQGATFILELPVERPRRKA